MNKNLYWRLEKISVCVLDGIPLRENIKMVNCILWHKWKFTKRITSTRVLKQILFYQSYFVILGPQYRYGSSTFDSEANFIELACLIHMCEI